VKVIDPGHDYLLGTLDGSTEVRLTFVKREGPGYPGNVGHHSGTTMQECLRALIDRAKYVNEQIPCPETESAIDLMRATILLFEIRAARRHGRELTTSRLLWLEDEPTCSKCGHIGCDGSCHD